MTDFLRVLAGLGPGIRLGLAALLLSGLVAIDVAEGGNFSLMPAYLLVILFVVWNAGVIWGGVFLAASLVAAVAIGEFYGHPFTSRGHFLIDVAGRFLVYMIMLVVAGIARNAYDREQALARSDGLTALPNRTAFHERVEIEIERQKRNGRPMTLAYLDIDNFKQVNDGHGHAAGDRLLQEVARTLTRNVRKTDVAARLGGDEFALLLPEAGAREASLVIDKLRDALRRLPQASAGLIGFSTGVVVARDPPQSADWLINQADQLMFAVKRGGKNGVKQLVLEPVPGNRAQPAGGPGAAAP